MMSYPIILVPFLGVFGKSRYTYNYIYLSLYIIYIYIHSKKCFWMCIYISLSILFRPFLGSCITPARGAVLAFPQHFGTSAGEGQNVSGSAELQRYLCGTGAWWLGDFSVEQWLRDTIYPIYPCWLTSSGIKVTSMLWGWSSSSMENSFGQAV